MAPTLVSSSSEDMASSSDSKESGHAHHLTDSVATSRTSSTSNSTSTNPSSTTTPALFLELFALVIAYAAPAYNPTTAHSLQIAHAHIASYKRARNDFLPLSFVCRAFHAFLKPFLFEVLILTRGRFSAIPLRYTLTRTDNWKHVKVVVYDGAPVSMDMETLAPGWKGATVISGMKYAIIRAEKECVCLSQEAHTLHIVGSYLSPGLVGIALDEETRFSPYAVPPSTRNLYWTHNSRVDTDEVQDVLRSASRTLETVDMYGWKSRPSEEHAPASDDALDSDSSKIGWGYELTRLALFGGLVSHDSIFGLLRPTIGPSLNDSSLRQLVLDSAMASDDMLELFKNDHLAPIWTDLTSLHISGQPINKKQYANLSLLVLRTCPTLSAFSYLAPTTDALFSLLPPSLRCLECLVQPASAHKHTLTPEACAAYLRDERSYKLEHLTVQIPQSCFEAVHRTLSSAQADRDRSNGGAAKGALVISYRFGDQRSCRLSVLWNPENRKEAGLARQLS